MPSLLAVSSVHNHLLRCGLRTQADLIVECGDAITAHDFATLVGYSASGIYPYLAHDTIASLAERSVLALDAETGIANYNAAILSGIVSIMSKMGISTMPGLPRRTDLRSGRSCERTHRCALHRHGQPHWRSFDR